MRLPRQQRGHIFASARPKTVSGSSSDDTRRRRVLILVYILVFIFVLVH